ncbi:MAG: DUF4846 domain-containing protein [Polyangiales bacterium]
MTGIGWGTLGRRRAWQVLVLAACGAGVQLAACGSCGQEEPVRRITRNLAPVQKDTAPVGLRCLRSAYPEHVCSVSGNELTLCNSGQKIVYDDGQPKTHAERLAEPDLQDTLAVRYDPNGSVPPAPEVEPGRVRHQPLLDAMYGATASEVRSHLTSVPWFGGHVEVTLVNGVAEQLRAVQAELQQLPAAVRQQLTRTAGTFNPRNIAGTGRRSAHSYGIAIDVAPQIADHWQWREPHADPPVLYRNRMPREVVHAFESAGFIWGGRWNHYDTMHFEYRPELFLPDCQAEAARAPGTAPPSAAGSRDTLSASTTRSRAQYDDDEDGFRRGDARASVRYPWLESQAAGTVRDRFQPPPGFERVAVKPSGFDEWLRSLPLQPEDAQVEYFDGTPKNKQNLHAAVLALDTGERDLQQCADAVMRLRAEYLFASRQADNVCFRAANGDALQYAEYRDGLRPPQGKTKPWTTQAQPDPSWTTFRRYEDLVFNFANTASLRRELTPVNNPQTITAGDVYIEGATGERYGHAVIVLDVAQSSRGERVFLIAQSYMPAQDMHILRNLQEPALGAWYRAPTDGSLDTPEWAFPAHSLRRFDKSCARRYATSAGEPGEAVDE